jgi:hypothetical protein
VGLNDNQQEDKIMVVTWKNLNKRQKRHLREMNINSLEAFKANHVAQERMRAENGHNPVIEPCWECKFIARDLGLLDTHEGS